MTAFERLSRFIRTAKERAGLIWKSAVAQVERNQQWLQPRTQITFPAAGIVIVVLLLKLSGATAAVAAAAVWIALMRNYEEAGANRKRRIAETYSRAVAQLASDKMEERLGGIYTLEQISKESSGDYWTVMETLTAFVRERTQRSEKERNSTPLEQRVAERAYFLWENAGRPAGLSERHRTDAVEQEKYGDPPATDIEAVLTVINRRSEESRQLELGKKWRLDLRGAVLRYADLREAHLQHAHFEGAHLERAVLYGAHLEGAALWHAHLERAFLEGAHLEGADLGGAYLKGAVLRGTDLRKAIALADTQLEDVRVDAKTRLPDGVARPKRWPPEEPEETAVPGNEVS
jgi:hypothetical protein